MTRTAALAVMNSLVIATGDRWGDVAYDFQRKDAAAVLDQASPTPYSFCTRSRGGSKTDDFAGLAVSMMLAQAPESARLFAAAADRDQAALFVESIRGFESRTPELANALRVDQFRVSIPRRNIHLEILASDAASSWGLRPYAVFIDEVAQWPTTSGPRVFFEALTSAVAKIEGARMAVITSAGDPSHWSYRILQHAREDPLWRTSEVLGPPPWIDPEKLAEQRRRLPESSYQRLFENVWTAATDRLVSPDDLAAAVTLDGPLSPERGRRYMIGLDLGLVNDRTVACVAHAEKVRVPAEKSGEDIHAASRIVLDRIQTWQGSQQTPVDLTEVESWIDETARLYNRAQIVYDPYQSVGLAQRLRGRGLRAQEFTFSSASVGRLAMTLYELLKSRRISLPDDDALLEELGAVRLIEKLPGVYRLDHDADAHDDRAVALALAAFGLLYKSGGVEAKVMSGIRYSDERVYQVGDLTLKGDRFFDKPAPWD